MSLISKKTAIITGSTSGIGLGIAKTLAKQNINIVLNGFGDQEEINKIIAEIKEYGVDAIYSNADITDIAAVEQMFSETITHFGKIDILVNNAGIQFVCDAVKFPLDKWHAIISTNLTATFYMSQIALKYFEQNTTPARIINIVSTHGLVGSKGKSAYVAAKHGVIGLTKVIALEYATSHITCNAICPGWVLTPLVKKQIEALQVQYNISYAEAEIKLLAEKHPSLRFTGLEQIGDMVLFLSSDSASNMTGSIITMDGGWTAV